ncbi:MAG: 54S ribosomal protein L22, mitochondrial [Sclerophora amabilis]|nr:MAG: 54S ribosomal protein L22, mitochondrial [Sclerophora amabilis]
MVVRPDGFLRTLFGFGKKNTKTIEDNPVYAEYLRKKRPPPPPAVTGDISSNSIFESESAATGTASSSTGKRSGGPIRNREAMAVVLDPQPDTRRRWERKMVIREIKSRGRLSRSLKIKRTERESTSRSHFLKTSVKKLGPLARQIAGKPIEEAIVQMRFSKKKAAKAVKNHLEHAKNTALVRNGMGLGAVSGTHSEPLEIQTKDGKSLVVRDRTGLYVDQAWVGRGAYEPEPEFRAKGQANMLRHPQTSITVLLKEEATRIRQHEEREQKIRRRKVWEPLPNRPITKQRPYYCW